MSSQDEARRELADDKVVREQLGDFSLRERLSRFVSGESNFRNMPKKVAVRKQRVDLAKRLAKQREPKQQAGIDNLKRHSQFNFTTGQTIQNEDGSVSSLRSGSVEDGRLNNGKPTLIPFVYDGELVNVDEAILRAIESGKKWPSFATNDAATVASKKISGELSE